MSAHAAPPAPVMVDIVELGDLGAQHDAKPLPVPYVAPWAPGDLPHGQDLDLNEYPVELLRLKKCRSFRADLRHKLTIIIRAHGGYGHRGVWHAAAALHTTRVTLWKWLRFDTSPRTRLQLERIDRVYSEALEKLVAEKVERKKYARQKRNAAKHGRHGADRSEDCDAQPDTGILQHHG